ncbi:MAG: NADH:flavin oxidoreductase [Deltaproteobacteria bacterium]|nr:NADH:flavin oxidoreductase [Deltaproteobacteria bacterium]
MPQLFETTQINGLALKNRFVRSATWTGLAQVDGICSMPLIDLYVRLAKGGAGLLITGHAYVQKNGQAGPWQLGIHNDRLLPGLRSLVNAVHENGAKIVIQLSHAGIYADLKLTGTAPFAISDIKGVVPCPVKEMTSEDFDAVINCFVKSALMAKAAGFDGIQLHAAHGYLISQSLSPAYNIRKDRYGGSIENRSLLLLTIVRQISIIRLGFCMRVFARVPLGMGWIRSHKSCVA